MIDYNQIIIDDLTGVTTNIYKIVADEDVETPYLVVSRTLSFDYIKNEVYKDSLMFDIKIISDTYDEGFDLASVIVEHYKNKELELLRHFQVLSVDEIYTDRYLQIIKLKADRNN